MKKIYLKRLNHNWIRKQSGLSEKSSRASRRPETGGKANMCDRHEQTEENLDHTSLDIVVIDDERRQPIHPRLCVVANEVRFVVSATIINNPEDLPPATSIFK
jgi:hypothetical protein